MNDDSVTIAYPEAEFALFNTSREDFPAAVVVNAALRHFPRRDIFPWHLSVLIFPTALAGQGMPTHAESAILDAVGDEIEHCILEHHNGLFLARETWNGRRQLLYRVHDPERANTDLQALTAEAVAKREWKFRMEHDASWSFAEPYLMLFESAPRKA